LRSIRAGQVVVPLTAADLDRMVELVETYGDFPLGLVDASVIAVAERLNADAIATLDHRHFSVVRPRHLPAFKLLGPCQMGSSGIACKRPGVRVPLAPPSAPLPSISPGQRSVDWLMLCRC